MTLEDGRHVLIEMNQVAELVEKAEARISAALSRIESEWDKRQSRSEREWIERQTRLERDWVERQNRVEKEWVEKYTLAVKGFESFETRLRTLEDTRMSGKGSWQVLAWLIGIVVTICCSVVAYTAVDEIRATRAQIWGQPAKNGVR